MRLDAAGVRIAAVETCDFGLMQAYGTDELLRAALGEEAERYLASPVSRRLLAELGVERRFLTTLPGTPPDPARLNAIDLGCSAVARLQQRRRAELEQLDAIIFVSTSNPNPCNSQAALLAERCGLSASCMDLKAGCSGAVLGVLQAALLVGAGCRRVLVVAAENLSHLAATDDIRMLLTVGDGAACVLVEAAPGPGFLAMLHGTEPAFARAMRLSAAFPPARPDVSYTYEFDSARDAVEWQRARWRSLFHEALEAAGTEADQLVLAALHQTHGEQLASLVRDLGLEPERVPGVVRQHGNMGSPSALVALAAAFDGLRPGDRYLLQAVGGGVSWCAIVAEHC
jgi:3-oxoacyl-[acyl-carrier-protein] synthase III